MQTNKSNKKQTYKKTNKKLDHRKVVTIIQRCESWLVGIKFHCFLETDFGYHFVLLVYH